MDERQVSQVNEQYRRLPFRFMQFCNNIRGRVNHNRMLNFVSFLLMQRGMVVQRLLSRLLHSKESLLVRWRETAVFRESGNARPRRRGFSAERSKMSSPASPVFLAFPAFPPGGCDAILSHS